jgi:hypothetical protein
MGRDSHKCSPMDRFLHSRSLVSGRGIFTEWRRTQ